jgi:hypothetical protein
MKAVKKLPKPQEMDRVKERFGMAFTCREQDRIKGISFYGYSIN